MMHILLDNTTHSTKRIWLYGLASLAPSALMYRLQLVLQMLERLSCWGGADKLEYVDHVVDMRSFELPKEEADAVYSVVKLLLEREGVPFFEGHPALVTVL